MPNTCESKNHINPIYNGKTNPQRNGKHSFKEKTTNKQTWEIIKLDAMTGEILYQIEFEGDNAQNPYVLGSHYNESETSSYADGQNNVKAIHTRSGTKIILNDGEGSVLIEDASGNTWQMDGQGNISVNAPKNFTINAGENIWTN